MGLTVVYPLRAQLQGDGLRYSLRSLAHLGAIDTVWVVGGRPDWLRGVVHLAGNPYPEKARNVLHNIRTAASHPDMARAFVLMNDDFYVMAPTAPAVHWREKLTEQIDAMTPEQQVAPHGSSLVATLDWLREHDITEPLSYEGHKPLPIDTAAFRTALRDVPDGAAMQARSLYGNLAGVGGTQMPDSKFRAGGYRGQLYISSNPTALQHGLGVYVRKRFPDPSPWERP